MRAGGAVSQIVDAHVGAVFNEHLDGRAGRKREGGRVFAELVQGVHWGAAAVAAVVWFVLGAAWYMAPPIAAAWQRAGGIEIDEDAGPNPMVFVLTLVAYFVATIVTSTIISGLGATSIAEGAAVGFFIGVGFALTAAAVTAIYDQKPEPVTHFWINGVFNLLGLVVAGSIIGAFL